jgi:hypothetical protein
MRKSGQREVERCAVIDLRIGPDVPAVPSDNLMHNCQPKTGTLEFFRAVQAVKDRKQFIRLPHIEANAIVLHVVHSFSIHLAAANLNDRLFTRTRIFERVTQQIVVDLSQQGRISLAEW